MFESLDMIFLQPISGHVLVFLGGETMPRMIFTSPPWTQKPGKLDIRKDMGTDISKCDHCFEARRGKKIKYLELQTTSFL